MLGKVCNFKIEFFFNQTLKFTIIGYFFFVRSLFTIFSNNGRSVRKKGNGIAIEYK